MKGIIGMKKVPRCWVGSVSISYSTLPQVVCADNFHTANKKSYVIATKYQHSKDQHGVVV